jgi:pimeloyl-ACP methyl ester carboxylesterase
MPFAVRDGVRLYYERAGHGDRSLVFVPGWCSETAMFQPQLDHFRVDHDVTAFDPRGCGRSDQPPTGYDLPNLADDVAWLCDHIGVSHPVVIGHSLGAMVAIETAARHPGLVRAVIADDPGPIDALPATRRVLADFVARMNGADGEAARRAWVEDAVAGTAGAERRAWIVDTMCSVPLAPAAAMIHAATVWDGPAALAACRAPLLVLRSSAGGSNDVARLRRHKPDLHYAVTVGAGHFHQLDAADQVTPMMARFLDVAVPVGSEPSPRRPDRTRRRR